MRFSKEEKEMTEKEALKESLAPCTETPVTSKISGRGKKKKKNRKHLLF